MQHRQDLDASWAEAPKMQNGHTRAGAEGARSHGSRQLPATRSFAQPPAKAKRNKFHLPNPMSLLLRRRSANAEHAGADDGFYHRPNAPVMRLPDNFDPRIRGSGVHDFSAPRTKPSAPRHHSQPAVEGAVALTELSQEAKNGRENYSAWLSPGDRSPLHKRDGSQQRSGSVAQENADSASNQSPLVLSAEASPGEATDRSPRLNKYQNESPLPHSWQNTPTRSIISRESNAGRIPSGAPVALQGPGDVVQSDPVHEQATDADSRLRVEFSAQQRAIPKHMPSNASRFSFDLAGVGSAVQEQLLEEKHRRMSERGAASGGKIAASDAADAADAADESDYGDDSVAVDSTSDYGFPEEEVPVAHLDIVGESIGTGPPGSSPRSIGGSQELAINDSSPSNNHLAHNFSHHALSLFSNEYLDTHTSSSSLPNGLLITDGGGHGEPGTSYDLNPHHTLDAERSESGAGWKVPSAYHLPRLSNASSAATSQLQSPLPEAHGNLENGASNSWPLTDGPINGNGLSISIAAADYIHLVGETMPMVSEEDDFGDTEMASMPKPMPGELVAGALEPYRSAVSDSAETGMASAAAAATSTDLYADVDDGPAVAADDDDDGDDDDDDDDAIIAAANAEALASDAEGFYGREFGFYACPVGRSNSGSGGSSSNSVAAEATGLGGYFGYAGHGMMSHSGTAAFQEPNLTPITERSEYSTRNSFIWPHHLSSSAAAQSVHSLHSLHGPSTPAAAYVPFAPRLSEAPGGGGDDGNEFEMCMASLQKLRRDAWGGSNSSLRSAESHHAASSQPATAANSALLQPSQQQFALTSPPPMMAPPAASAGEQAHTRPGQHDLFSSSSRTGPSASQLMMGGDEEEEDDDDDDDDASDYSDSSGSEVVSPVASPTLTPLRHPPVHAMLTTAAAAAASAQPVGHSSAGASHDTVPSSPPLSPARRRSSSSLSPPPTAIRRIDNHHHHQPYHSPPPSPTPAPATAPLPPLPSPPPPPPASNDCARKSVRYLKEEADGEPNSCGRWILERIQRSETGAIEVIERKVVDGGTI